MGDSIHFVKQLLNRFLFENEVRVVTAMRYSLLIQSILFVLISTSLLIMPVTILEYFGWLNPDGIFARLFSVMMIGFSLNMILNWKSAEKVIFKLVNQTFYIVSGLLAASCISLIVGTEGRPAIIWLMCLIFLLLHLFWLYWRIMIKEVAQYNFKNNFKTD